MNYFKKLGINMNIKKPKTFSLFIFMVVILHHEIWF